MKQAPASTARTLLVALTVISFVAISSYVYLSPKSVASPTTTYQTSVTSSQQVVTQSASQLYDFGNHYFEPPSAILISGNTLTWTNFQLNNNTNFFVAPSFSLLPFTVLNGTRVTVAVYLNGVLIANSTTTLPDINYAINSSLMPTSNASNTIFSLTGLTPTYGVSTQTASATSLNGSTISFAIISDRPIWLSGWTQNDMAGGSGPHYGESPGQLSSTFETPETAASLPNSLPQPTTSLTFELQMLGGLMA